MPPENSPPAYSRPAFLSHLGMGAAFVALPPLVFAEKPTTPASPAAVISLEASKAFVRLSDGQVAGSDIVRIDRTWKNSVCQSRLVNVSAQPVAIKEVVLFAGPHAFGAETTLYG